MSQDHDNPTNIDDIRNDFLLMNEVYEELRTFVAAQRKALEADGFSPTAAEVMAIDLWKKLLS